MSNQGYHISKGADDIYWILNDGEHFVKNLSKDLDTAKIRAEEKLGFVPPVDIWHRKKFIYVAPKYKTPDWLLFQEHIFDYKKHLARIEFLAAKKDCESRQYVGSVGDILEMELELIEKFSFDSDYGYCTCYKFKDSNNNRFIYFGTSNQLNSFKNSGDKFIISFEIKRQFINERDSQIPYKINQIKKVKSKAPVSREFFIQIHDTNKDILDINVEFYSSKNINFNFTTYKKEKISFYPKGIKSFKAAKEFLKDLENLTVLRILTKEVLLRNDLVDYINKLLFNE